MKLLKFISSLALSLLMLASCKPTEKGYQSAYDAAQHKRDSFNASLGVNIPEGALQQVDGPQLKEIDGKSVYVLNRRLKALDNDSILCEYNVAVGEFKMSTNAIALAENLRKEGYKAFAAADMDEKYFTIASTFSNMADALSFLDKYKSAKDRVYVGLPEAPVIIYTPLK